MMGPQYFVKLRFSNICELTTKVLTSKLTEVRYLQRTHRRMLGRIH